MGPPASLSVSSTEGWTGFIKPNIGGRANAGGGQTIKLFTQATHYSGGFIDKVKDDTTLVITAARHDRQSFGCADENDFTYFGRAFFKESLPKSRSFHDAFRSAEKLIKDWETKEIKQARKSKKDSEEDYSIPQMVGTSAIEQHLREWWGR
jgi:Peptidase C13 family